MTAMTRSMITDEVLAARNEIQSRLPARTASITQRDQEIKRYKKSANIRTVIGVVSFLGGMIAEMISSNVAAQTSVFGGAFLLYRGAYILAKVEGVHKRYQEQRRQDGENFRAAIPREDLVAYRNLVKTYVKSRPSMALAHS